MYYSIIARTSPQSSLLQCILKELPALSGDVMITGKVAFASQESWLYSATLRENILFGLSYSPEWYSTVIEACALERVGGMANNKYTVWYVHRI